MRLKQAKKHAVSLFGLTAFGQRASSWLQLAKALGIEALNNHHAEIAVCSRIAVALRDDTKRSSTSNYTEAERIKKNRDFLKRQASNLWLDSLEETRAERQAHFEARSAIEEHMTPEPAPWTATEAEEIRALSRERKRVAAELNARKLARAQTRREKREAKQRRTETPRRKHTEPRTFVVNGVPTILAVDPRSPEFLGTYAWRELRMQTLKKWGARCQCCGATPDTGAVMCVDHIKPRRDFPELALDPDNLQVLCGACNHGKANWDTTDWRPTLTTPAATWQPPQTPTPPERMRDADWPRITETMQHLAQDPVLAANLKTMIEDPRFIQALHWAAHQVAQKQPPGGQT